MPPIIRMTDVDVSFPSGTSKRMDVLRNVLGNQTAAAALQASLTGPEFASLNTDARQVPEVRDAMWSPTPEPSSNVDNHMRVKAIAWLSDWVDNNQIVHRLNELLLDQDKASRSYLAIIADAHRQLESARIDLGLVDQVDRNRTEFKKLLTQTFTIKLGPLGINPGPFIKLVEFIYKRKPAGSE